MSNSKFKIDDKVLFIGDVLDIDADMQQDLVDRSISGSTYDGCMAALRNKQPLTVKVVCLEDRGVSYELSTEKGKRFTMMFDEEDLIKYEPAHSPV